MTVDQMVGMSVPEVESLLRERSHVVALAGGDDEKEAATMARQYGPRGAALFVAATAFCRGPTVTPVQALDEACHLYERGADKLRRAETKRWLRGRCHKFRYWLAWSQRGPTRHGFREWPVRLPPLPSMTVQDCVGTANMLIALAVRRSEDLTETTEHLAVFGAKEILDAILTRNGKKALGRL